MTTITPVVVKIEEVIVSAKKRSSIKVFVGPSGIVIEKPIVILSRHDCLSIYATAGVRFPSIRYR